MHGRAIIMGSISYAGDKRYLLGEDSEEAGD
jgi:hypothetical protein